MSGGYIIPVSIDLGDSIAKMDALTASMEKVKEAATDSQSATNSMNKEIVEGGNKANKVIEENAKASIDAKKAAEERARVEKIVQQATAELTKEIDRQNKSLDESVKANKRQQDALKEQIEHEKDMRKILEEKIKLSEQEAQAQNAVNASTKVGTQVTNALTIAIRSFITLGLGAVLAGLVIYWEDLKRAITGVTKEMELLDKVKEASIARYAEEKVHVENLWRESQKENITKERTIEIINELNKLSPHYFGDIKTEKDLHDQGAEAIGKYIKALELKARAQAAQEIYVEELKVQMRMEQQSMKDNASAWAYWGGTVLELMGKASVATSLYATSASKNFDEVNESTSRAFDVMKKAMDDVSELNEKGPFSPKDLKDKSDQYLKILEAFLQQRKTAELESINDENQRALQAEEVRFAREKREIQQRVLEYKGSNEKKAELVKAAAITIEELETAHIAKLAAIALKGIEADIKKEEEADKLISAIRKKSLDQQIIDVEKKYSDINDKVAAAGKLTAELEKELAVKQAAEIIALKDKFALEALKKDEAIALANIDALELKGNNEVKIARVKEGMKLQVMIEAAQDRLQLLRVTGGVENELIIAQTEALIQNLKVKLKTLGKKNEGIDLLDLLGIENPERTLGKIGALEELTQGIGDIFSGIADSYQIAINKKEEQIKVSNKQVSELEKNLAKEKRLQEKGFANNVSLMEKELQAAQAHRKKLEKEQEELERKQQAAQRAQIIADTVSQTSDLITSSSSIFKGATRFLGPFGIPVAVAAIAAMFSAFAISKANAFKAVGAGQKFGGGGQFVLDGPSHSEGGLGVYNEKTGERVAEVEGKEGFFAINKKSTRKHLGLLNAINNDDFGDFTKFQSSLNEILEHAGVSFPEHEQMSQVVVVAQQNSHNRNEQYHGMMAFFNQAALLGDIANSNNQMLKMEKGRGEVKDMGSYVEIRKGNVTRKIKKHV